MKSSNLMIVQGGGPTPVLNASLQSVIAEATRSVGFAKIFGARAGTVGLTRGDFVDLSGLSSAALDQLSRSPGAALGTSRFKPEGDDLQCQLEHLRRLNVRCIVFMGGNGTMQGAEIVSAFCRSAGYEVQVMGVPKTIDNDLAMTDRSPGYSSAARYVAQSTRELALDLRSLPQPVTILETMGRSVGWLAAAASLAKVEASDGPQLICVPEVPFDQQAFLTTLEQSLATRGWALAVVAEGIRHADGSLVYQVTDPNQMDGLKRPLPGGVGRFLAGIVAENLKIRCRSEIPGLLGRSSMAHVSAQDRRDAQLVGRAAVQALAKGESDQMVALRPIADPGAEGYDLVPLSAVSGVERPLPREWLTDGPMAVSHAFENYLSPLVGELNQYFPEFSVDLSYRGASS